MSAAWLNKFRQASFRGVKFFIEGHDLAGGRRGVQHEYAQRDKPFTEDTGRKGRKFDIEAYVIGDNYFPARDALLKAVEQEGPGELIHPYLGRQIVNCFDFRLKETKSQMGMAIFTLSFVESGQVEFPSAADDTAFLIQNAAELNIANLQTAFVNKFTVDNKPQFLKDDVIAKINSYTTQIKSISEGLSSKKAEVIAELAFAIENFSASAVDLIEKPAELAKQYADSLRLLRNSADSVDEVFAAINKFFGFGDDDSEIEITTPNRDQQQDNRDAVNDLIIGIAISEAATAAQEIQFTSLNDANGIRDQITDKIDTQSENLTDDNLFQSMQDLRANTVLGVPSPEQNLAFIASIKLNKSLPSLVLSYDLYESLDLEQDIVDRNKVANPAFVPGGVNIEVLQVE